MSRAIEGRMIFDDVAKERFRALLDAQLAFSGLRLVTFCLMGNHLIPAWRPRSAKCASRIGSA